MLTRTQKGRITKIAMAHDDERALAAAVFQVAHELKGIALEIRRAADKIAPEGIAFKYSLGPVLLKSKPSSTMDITLTNEQQVHATLTPVTPKGKPAQLDGKPVWSVSSGDCTVQNVSDDGLQADLVSGDSPGDSEILIEADADLGAGVVTVSDVVKVTVVGAMATSLGLKLDQPVDKP